MMDGRLNTQMKTTYLVEDEIYDTKRTSQAAEREIETAGGI